MYCEDVDLSFRLRANGFLIRYLPDCKVEHVPFSKDGKQKIAQAAQEMRNNVLLRARYGRWSDLASGLIRFLGEMIIRKMRGDKAEIAHSIKILAKDLFDFRISGRQYRKKREWKFIGWRFSHHRSGARYVSKCANLEGKRQLYL